jgi:pimeloyl-ACP methyl ester carboxylesterase
VAQQAAWSIWQYIKFASISVVLLGVLSFVAGVFLAEGSVRRPVAAFSRAVSSGTRIAIAAHDSVRLVGWFSTPLVPNGRCVILLHGVGDSHQGMTGIARMFLTAGYRTLVPDSRGHGESGGAFVTYGLLERRDVTRWINWLSNAECDQGIFALGESMGAAALLEALDGETRIRAAVAECAFSSFKQVAAERISQRIPLPHRFGVLAGHAVAAGGVSYIRLRYGFDLTSVSPNSALQRVRVPVLLIHGLDDWETLPEHSRVLHRTCGTSELWEIPGAGHTAAFATNQEAFRDRVLAWFDSKKSP